MGRNKHSIMKKGQNKKKSHRTIKKIVCVFLLLTSFGIQAQTRMGTSQPESSSALEISSSDKGLLVPRMTTAQRDAIETPAQGLLIYNTTLSGFNYFDVQWNDYQNHTKSFHSNAVNTIATAMTTNQVVSGMTLAPAIAGKYKVTFNSQYNNAPIENAPISASQCVIDLQAAYDQLMALPATNTTHQTVLGNGETFLPGVYTFAGATSTDGILNFDAEGNPDALFVFRISAAFSTVAHTTMILRNGAKACNIFWVVEAAPSFATATILKGTVIAHAGAIAMATGGMLEGRLFSIVGAISFGPGVARVPSGNSSINLGALNHFVLFTSNGAVSNEGTSLFTGDIGSNLGLISGFELPTIVDGAFLAPGTSIITTSPNETSSLATFSIYQNGILIPSSSKILTSSERSVNVSLQAIATIDANQTIDIRWKTGSEKIVMGNRTLTLIKVQ